MNVLTSSALFVLNVVTLLLDVLAHDNDPTGSTTFIYVNQAWVHLTAYKNICFAQLVIFNSISATLIARFILDLRSADSSTITADQVSSVQFAADLAAPLGPDSTWVTGQSDDLENDPEHLDPCFDQSPEPAQPVQEAA